MDISKWMNARKVWWTIEYFLHLKVPLHRALTNERAQQPHLNPVLPWAPLLSPQTPAFPLWGFAQPVLPPDMSLSFLPPPTSSNSTYDSESGPKATSSTWPSGIAPAKNDFRILFNLLIQHCYPPPTACWAGGHGKYQSGSSPSASDDEVKAFWGRAPHASRWLVLP